MASGRPSPQSQPRPQGDPYRDAAARPGARRAQVSSALRPPPVIVPPPLLGTQHKDTQLARRGAGTWRQGHARTRTPEDLAATPDSARPSSPRGPRRRRASDFQEGRAELV